MKTSRAKPPSMPLILVSLLWMLTTPTTASSAPEGIAPLLPDGTAHGLTLAEWSAAWFQWNLSIPASSNPNAGRASNFYGVGQRAPVWFLPAPDGPSATEAFIVPAGQSLLLPAVFTAYLEKPGLLSEQQLRAEVREIGGLDNAILKVSVDGVPVADPKRYRVQAPLFTVILPPGNLVNEAVNAGNGRRDAVADGYWFLFPSLPVGQHEIRLEYERQNTNGSPFKVQASYTVNIVNPGQPNP